MNTTLIRNVVVSLIVMSLILAFFTYRSSSWSDIQLTTFPVDSIKILSNPFTPSLMLGTAVNQGQVIGYMCTSESFRQILQIERILEKDEVTMDTLLQYALWLGIDVNDKAPFTQSTSPRGLERKLQSQQLKLRTFRDSLETLQTMAFTHSDISTQQRIKVIADEMAALRKSIAGLIVATDKPIADLSHSDVPPIHFLKAQINSKMDSMRVRSDISGYMWSTNFSGQIQWMIISDLNLQGIFVGVDSMSITNEAIRLTHTDTIFIKDRFSSPNGNLHVTFNIIPSINPAGDTLLIELPFSKEKQTLLHDWLMRY